MKNIVSNHIQNRQRGSALLMAIVLTAIMAVVALFAYQSTIFQNRMAERSTDYFNALNTAESGAELAMVELNRKSGSTPAAWTSWSGSGTEKTITSIIKDDKNKTVGETKVTVSGVGTQNPIIKSTGFIPSITNATVKRTVQLVAKNDTIPSPFGSFGIFGYESVTFKGSQAINSYNASTGAYGTGKANVGSMGDISFNGASVVNGNVQAGGTLDKKGAVVINGQAVDKSNPTPPPAIEYPPYDPNPPLNNDNSKITGASNIPANGNFEIKNSNVTLPAPGTYYFNNLSFKGAKTLSIVGDGAVTIYATSSVKFDGAQAVNVSGKANVTIVSPTVDLEGASGINLGSGSSLTVVGDNVTMAGSTGMSIASDSVAKFFIKKDLTINGASSMNAGGKPSQLQIFAEDKVSLTKNGASVLVGGIYAPKADLTINGACAWKGAFIANNILVHGASSFMVEDSILTPTGGDGVYVNAWVEVKPQG